MADKRINALTTTSASVGDDYFAIDGATNGTRALSAFSPTFGGNATVTGTLSSGGNLSVTGTSAQVILGQASGSQLTYLIRPAQAGGAIQMVQDSATANRWLSLGISDNVGVYSELMRVAGATGNILIPGTVASTTTSSGALVVGNGTSGGLGVGGDIHASNVSSFSSSAVRAKLDSSGQVSWGVSANQGILTWDTGKARIGGQGTNDVYLVTNSTAERVKVAYSDGAVSVLSTTASTSTSSGALVVSGGVGVAGAINAGGAVTVAGGSFAAASFYKSASLGTVLSGATGSSYDLYLTNPAGNYVMQVPTGTRNAEFAATLTTVGAITSGASISTSAPVGGAGAWELGTYSSTAPSATGYVTIEIGGTVYKLLASNV